MGLAKVMNYIADDNNLWDKPIDELDWDVDVMKCDEIDNEEDNEW